MTDIILIGIPASGKRTFYKDRLFNSHVRFCIIRLKEFIITPPHLQIMQIQQPVANL